MDFARNRSRLPSVRAMLLLDVVFEFTAGAALLLLAGALGRWLGMGATASVVAGVIFLAAGAALIVLWRLPEPDRGVVRALAAANVLGGIAGWCVLLVAWPQFEPEGRAVLGMASDLFIAIGVLEWLALRDLR